MNSGTRTTAPVSSSAGLPPPVAVSPRTPGSDLTIFSSTWAGAVEVSAFSGAANLAGKAPAKTLFLDVVAALNSHGLDSVNIPAKLEGMAFGPDISIDGVLKRTLFISNDNDYLATLTDSNHPNGIENANRWFVFAVDASDLPKYVPQAST